VSRIEADLDEQLEAGADDLRRLQGTRLFITGGTGFVGSWLLESIRHANARLALRIRAVVLTRDPARVRETLPHIAREEAFSFVAGDVRTPPQDLGSFDGIIHAATPASADLNRNEPLEMLDTIVEGGRAVLALAARSGKIPFLFTSSGAVYGPQPPELTAIPESYRGAPDQLLAQSAYHEGKRVGELQGAIAHAHAGVQTKVARLFAFIGPYLPLDRHFAAGNFIRDALAGRPIVVGGDGTTVRSYLYAGEMVTWLWAIYVRGEPVRAYNVGSDVGVDIATLARSIAASFPIPPPVEIRGVATPGRAVDRYVPSTQRIQAELGLTARIGLAEGISRTIEFYRSA
jgi:nucleoside-diphosphate-sugar epimerase